MSTIPPVNPLNPPPSTAAPSATGTNSLGDSDTFLKLLVAELKYQNPMSPADPMQYLAQTAQFTMVQKLSDMDTQVASMLTASRQAAAASLIGRGIVGTTVAGKQVTGTVDGLQMSSDGPLLMVQGQAVPMTNVVSVSAAATANAAPATSPTTPTSAAATPTTSPATPTIPPATSTAPPATSTTPATPTTPATSTTPPA